MTVNTSHCQSHIPSRSHIFPEHEGEFWNERRFEGIYKTRRGIKKKGMVKVTAAGAAAAARGSNALLFQRRLSGRFSLRNQILAFHEACCHLHMKHGRIIAVFRSSFLILHSSEAASHHLLSKELGTSPEKQDVSQRVDKPPVAAAWPSAWNKRRCSQAATNIWPRVCH